MKKVLVTGAAGFIGFHTVMRLLKENFQVVGLDNINDYYDPKLKYGRLEETGISKDDIIGGDAIKSTRFDHYTFYQLNLEDRDPIFQLFTEEKIDYVIHLAAQAGVRYSLINPHAYTESNITGFLNILEACRHHMPLHLVYASSSSVYGSNKQMPFSEHDNVDHPVSLYAATKKANELMAHTYSHLFGIPTTGLRFFTVYGPWGRPDMAVYLFTKAITKGEPISVFNNGHMKRDFTYIDDIVEGIYRLMLQPATPSLADQHPTPDLSSAPFRIFNIGNSKPEPLMDFIFEIENALGRKAIVNLQPIQPGDVPETWASTRQLEQAVGYHPQTSIRDGIKNFIQWYLRYYNL